MPIIRILIESFPLLMKGLEITLLLTLFSIVFGTIWGISLALGKIYGNKYVSWLASAYIEIIRGTPLLVQLFILYFALPKYGIKLNPFIAATIGFTLNSGAYQAEYLRGSIQSIGSDQMRAAYSIGMGKWQGIKNIILPQAFRRVIPAWTNEFIYLLKYTSLAYMIGAHEIMAQAKFYASRNFEYLKVFSLVAIVYLIVVIVFTRIFNWIEEKFKIPGFEYYH